MSDIIKDISCKGGGAWGGKGSLLRKACLSPTLPRPPIKHITDLNLVDDDTK